MTCSPCRSNGADPTPGGPSLPSAAPKGPSRNDSPSGVEDVRGLNIPLWADRARDELARADVGTRRMSSLSPSEQRVADLAASGMTNRDVAAALFISPKTVESNLARIYRKLGIHSRAELGRHMGQPDT